MKEFPRGKPGNEWWLQMQAVSFLVPLQEMILAAAAAAAVHYRKISKTLST